MIATILGSVFNLFTKVLPLLFAYKSGKDSAKLDQLEEVVDVIKEANEVEDSINRANSSDIHKRLQRWVRR
jgi:hypothetical protein